MPMEENKKSIFDFTKDSYTEFGTYVNTSRHIPLDLDGLKPSYRRVLYSTLTLPDKMRKVASIAGDTGGKYSPHSQDSLNDVINVLVRSKVLDGQGSHGEKHILQMWNTPPAAPRYIEAKLNSEWRKMMSPLLPYISYHTSELDHKEPDYLPTPVPISCLFSSLGLGIGIRTIIPTFSFSSMLDAYRADDPSKLKPNSDIILNKRKSDLTKLWTGGTGRVSYMFKIDEDATSLDGSKGIMMYGDPVFHQITLTNKLMKQETGDREKDAATPAGWIDQGLVVMNDESTLNECRLFFKVAPRVSKVTKEMLRAELEIVRFVNLSCKLAVYDGSCVSTFPLRSWIDTTFNRYTSLVADLKADRSSKYLFELEVLNKIPSIIELIPQGELEKPIDYLSTKLDTSENVVKAILNKPIRFLKSLDVEKELAEVNSKLDHINKVKPEDFYGNIE